MMRIKIAKNSRSTVPGTCDAAIPPASPPKIAATPIGRAACHSTALCRWWASAPLIMVGRITASDVPNATRIASVESIPPRVYSQNWTGVIRDPPPTPKAPDSIPATIPVIKRMAYWTRGSMGAPENIVYRYYIPGVK